MRIRRTTCGFSSKGAVQRLASPPRIDVGNADPLEGAGVAGHDCEAVNKSCRGEQAIDVRGWVACRESSPSLGYGEIDRQDPIDETLLEHIEPGFEDRRLMGVS